MRQLAAFLLLVAACAGEAITESGYLLTAPKVFQAGTSERACLTLHKLEGPGRSVRMTFYETNIPDDQLDVLDESDFLLFQTQAEIPDSVAGSGEYCFDIAIPATVTARSADVRMTLSSPQFTFSEKNEVTIKSEAMITLVQTDKAKYQPGQKVLFRILTLRHDLTSLNDDLEEVWITTPQRTRLAQWRDVKSNTGMVQLEMQLTEETPLGSWTIHVKTPQGVVRKSFSVEEYVLPTFEVTIEGPDRIESFARTITAKVCAKYTFGKPLINANVTINATADISDYYYRNNDDLKREISDYFASDEEGCATFDLLVGKLGIGNSRFGSYHTITLSVEVEEEGTGLKQSESKQVSQSSSSITLREAGGSQERFFKPGLPFYGQYVLKRNDDQPAVKEIVKVCHTATYKDRATSLKKRPTPDDFLYRANEKYEGQVESIFGYEPLVWETEKAPTRTTRRDCREYETDENGIIYYYIPAQAEDVDSLSVDISSNTESGSDSSYNTYRAFFSPSGSYISIDAHKLPDILPCSGDVSVSILTSLRPNTTAPESMVYKILSRGKIIKVGQTGVDLTFPILPKMAPEFKLLIYYVLDSGEVVSDSRVMKVAKCFPNQVQVNWDQETVKPGDSASLTIRAAPNSVCGVSAVDRSVELLGTENQITMDTVFSRLDQFVINSYQSPQQVRSDDDYCKDVQIDVVRALQGGGATKDDLTPPPKKKDSDGHRISSSRPFPDPTFRTDRDDSLKVFDKAGFLVMSNLGLENRPCYKRVPPVEIPEEILQSQRRPGPAMAYDDPGTISLRGGFVPQSFGKSSARSGEAAPEKSQGSSNSQGSDQAVEDAADQVRNDFTEAFLFSVETMESS